MDYQLGPGPLQVDQNTIDEKIKGDIGIVENGDVATHAIPSGYYVIWKGDLYVAKTDISSGTTLSAASNGNLTAKMNGLGAEVAMLNNNKANIANLSYGSYTYTSQAAMETGLVNLATTLGASKTTVIYLYPNFGSTIFAGAPGVATIETGASVSYFSVLFHNYGGVFYGKYLNGTWTWDSLALSSKTTFTEELQNDSKSDSDLKTIALKAWNKAPANGAGFIMQNSSSTVKHCIVFRRSNTGVVILLDIDGKVKSYAVNDGNIIDAKSHDFDNFTTSGTRTEVAQLTTSGTAVNYTASQSGYYTVLASTANTEGTCTAIIQDTSGNTLLRSTASLAKWDNITCGLLPLKAGTTIKAVAVFPSGGAGSVIRIS